MTNYQRIAIATKLIDQMDSESDTVELCAEPISGTELADWILDWLED